MEEQPPRPAHIPVSACTPGYIAPLELHSLNMTNKYCAVTSPDRLGILG